MVLSVEFPIALCRDSVLVPFAGKFIVDVQDALPGTAEPWHSNAVCGDCDKWVSFVYGT